MLLSSRRSGFTLIEMLAVVAIIALLVSVTAPNLGAVRERWLRNQTRQVASYVELARQRAVMTGVPHRVLLNLEEGSYRLEWKTHDEEDDGRVPARPGYEPRDVTRLSLSPPPAREVSFRPVPGNMGIFHYLADEIDFAGLETPQGWVDRGEFGVVFDEDGTADHNEIMLENQRGERMWLEIRPIADAVRIFDDEA